MSWDAYIDYVKGCSANKVITEAVIYSKEGSPWTPETENLKALDAKCASTITSKKPDSITINGVKYMYLRTVDEDEAYQMLYKKKDVGSLCVAVTQKAISIAFTPDNLSYASGEANQASQELCKYLLSVGY